MNLRRLVRIGWVVARYRLDTLIPLERLPPLLRLSLRLSPLRLLQGDTEVSEIRDRDAHSRKMGVSSVPTYIVANQHAVPGAQPPELWKQVIADRQSRCLPDRVSSYRS